MARMEIDNSIVEFENKEGPQFSSSTGFLLKFLVSGLAAIIAWRAKLKAGKDGTFLYKNSLEFNGNVFKQQIIYS